MSAAEFVCRFPADAAFFAGHFPGRPIVPGVLLLDQAILYAEACQGGGARRWQIAQAKFFRPVAAAAPGRSPPASTASRWPAAACKRRHERREATGRRLDGPAGAQ